MSQSTETFITNQVLVTTKNKMLDVSTLRQQCLESGADDAGFVELDRPELADHRQGILAAFPKAKALISFACRMNREPIRSAARSIANLEFHHTGEHVNEVGRKIVSNIERKGIGAIYPSMGFPMEMDNWSGKLWVVSHKPVAVAAGLGIIGIHRNVIHPEFGNFILLGTIVIDTELSSYDHPIDYDPCMKCKLCVAACPVGAICADGAFNFSSCYTQLSRIHGRIQRLGWICCREQKQAGLPKEGF